MTRSPLEFNANWQLGESGRRQHYLVEMWLDDELIGRAHGWCETGVELVLEKIEVDASQRSKGYGTAVIEQLRARAREQQCREFVIKGVRVANHGAIRLYESLGGVVKQTSDDLCSFVISPP